MSATITVQGQNSKPVDKLNFTIVVRIIRYTVFNTQS